MSKFKVGDRVRVYGHGSVAIEDCTVVSVGQSHLDDIEIRPDGETRTWPAHSKQCRRLKPRAPLRRVWVPIHRDENEVMRAPVHTVGLLNKWLAIKPCEETAATFVEFVEVRKKSESR